MNPLGWVLNALKTWPEPPNLPAEIDDLTPLELAEIRSRLQTFAQVATELRRQVDQELAGRIPTALRYGEDVYRPSNGRGSAKVVDDEAFYEAVAAGIERSEDYEIPHLLAALFPTHSVKVGGLPSLAEVLDVPPDVLKETLIGYGVPSSPLSVMPMSKAPKFLQDLEEGEIR